MEAPELMSHFTDQFNISGSKNKQSKIKKEKLKKVRKGITDFLPPQIPLNEMISLTLTTPILRPGPLQSALKPPLKEPKPILVPQLSTIATSKYKHTLPLTCSEAQLWCENLGKYENKVKKYITRCYDKCNNDMGKDRVSMILREKLPLNYSYLGVINLYDEPLRVLEKSPYVQRTSAVTNLLQRKKPLFIELWGRSSARSPLKRKCQSPTYKGNSNSSLSSEGVSEWEVPPHKVSSSKRNNRKTWSKNFGEPNKECKRKDASCEKFRNVTGEVPVNAELLENTEARFVSSSKRSEDLLVLNDLDGVFSGESSKECKIKDAICEQFRSVTGEVPVTAELLEKRAARFVSISKRTEDLPVLDDWDGDFDLERFHIIGTSQKIEKPYFRMTGAPVPLEVRPPEVLRQSFKTVKEHWLQNHDYRYACGQLKSIRQDLMVQGIRDKLAVRVYETHARMALEKSDCAEFNQCLSVLKLLHEELPDVKRGEFTAYRILYCIYTKETMDLNAVIMSLSESDQNDSSVQHALSVRSAWVLKNYHQLFKLYLKAPHMSSYLMDWFLDRERKLAIETIIKAYRQTMPLSFLTKELAFKSDSSCLEFLSEFGLIWSGLVW